MLDSTANAKIDKQFAVSGNWAIASDGIQWILQRRAGRRWKAVSFVRSTKAILARCMREKHCPPPDQLALLDGLPNTFDEWAVARDRAVPSGLTGSADAAQPPDTPGTPAPLQDSEAVRP